MTDAGIMEEWSKQQFRKIRLFASHFAYSQSALGTQSEFAGCQLISVIPWSVYILGSDWLQDVIKI